MIIPEIDDQIDALADMVREVEHIRTRFIADGRGNEAGKLLIVLFNLNNAKVKLAELSSGREYRQVKYCQMCIKQYPLEDLKEGKWCPYCSTHHETP